VSINPDRVRKRRQDAQGRSIIPAFENQETHRRMTRLCAFLTMDNMDGFVCDDDLALPAMRSLGWDVDRVSWRNPDADWSRYAIVVIRSAWDYTRDLDGFLAVLQAIETAGVPLQNPLALVRWNLHKSYLQELAAQGIAIVPTRWVDRPRRQSVEALFKEFGCQRLVIKPAVGANAEHAHVLDSATLSAQWPAIEPVFSARQAMIQPFRPAIQEEGEYSLMFMGNRLSHAILKTPKKGDFRSQEEHGSRISAAKPEPQLVQRAQQALGSLPCECLYARADMVRNPAGDFELMELELVEPSLYLRMDPEAPTNLARAIIERAGG